MIGYRFDAGFRVGPSSSEISITYPTGGAAATATVASGMYLTAASLASAIDTAVKAVNANLSCTTSGRTFTIASAALNFDAVFAQRTLRTHLGAGASYTNVASLTGDPSPGIFISTYPWHGQRLTWVRHRKIEARDHNRAAALTLSGWREWGGSFHLLASEVAAFRTVMSTALRGLPFSWYRNAADSAAWSFPNWDGRLEVVLTEESRAYVDRWLTSPHQTAMSVPLVMREYTA